ncbi:hypothetical protein N0V85_002037 [Neurospora sp. IMI 360204]|nr:hypothetical protein N0V85_002037 [Neurospora sp. IMI 360204]
MDPKQAKAETEPLGTRIPITDPNNVVYTDDKGVQHKIWLPPPGTRIPGAQPNCLWYTDNKGVERSIYLPQGTMHTAWDHLENERWDELAKFEPYTDQGYTEDDFKASEERHKQLEG